MAEIIIPLSVRVSIGSAILLGLTQGTLNVKPTTVYLLTYHKTKCSADCGFCSQARSSKSRDDLLSRVTWPIFQLDYVVAKLKLAVEKKLIDRICIQVMNYPNVFDEILELVRRLHLELSTPISISCQPLDLKQIKKLAESGIDRIGIPLDTPTKELFKRVKGKPYVWESQIEALENAVQILGRGRVSTHLIVGLGERDDELLRMIQRMIDMGVYPSLFAFTPIRGTRLEKLSQPPFIRYRMIQLAHYLITNIKTRIENMSFDEDGFIIDFGVDDEMLRGVISLGTPFVTSGCPGCNRPYYNERPGGPLYNYPQKPNYEELIEIKRTISGETRLKWLKIGEF
ncbi:MAG: Radical protein [Thermoproteota archaeon]|nr:Radical protein [Thermoproteota archaeon]